MDESEVKFLEQQQVGTLKLSAAIRIGARFRPQHYGMADTNHAGRSCALGAADEALTGKYNGYGSASGQGFETTPPRVIYDVWHKNDYDKWTREQIADWLEEQGY